jgi:hypothetical protein
MMRSIAIGLVMAVCVSTAFAKEVVQEFSWSEAKKTGGLIVGEILPCGPWGSQEQLKIDNPTGKPKTVALLDLKNPAIASLHYAVEGTVRYENVSARSYLEMWSWFANGGRYFSRTLGESGPTKYLEGSSGWRPFSLPFLSDKKNGLPVRVVVNVVFADGGTVYLTPVKLLQYSNDWWTEQAGGWIGGIGGSILGLLGGVIGILSGIGRARRFVLVLTATLAALGVASLVLGLIALALGQLYAVCYPLLLGGIILAAVCGGNFPVLRRRFEQIELRKMAAMDAGLANSRAGEKL